MHQRIRRRRPVASPSGGRDCGHASVASAFRRKTADQAQGSWERRRSAETRSRTLRARRRRIGNDVGRGNGRAWRRNARFSGDCRVDGDGIRNDGRVRHWQGLTIVRRARHPARRLPGAVHRARSRRMRAGRTTFGCGRTALVRRARRLQAARGDRRDQQRTHLEHCQRQCTHARTPKRVCHGRPELLWGRITTRASTYAVRKVPTYRPVPDPPAHSGNLAVCRLPARVGHIKCTICAQPQSRVVC